MASGWLKMRMDLQSHPKVVRILSAMRLKDGATQTDKFRVIGGLHAVWSVFDTHSEDGRLYGYTPETLNDHVIGWEGVRRGHDAGRLALPLMEQKPLKCLGFLSITGSLQSAGQRTRNASETQEAKRKMSAICPKTMRTKSGLEKRREE